MLSLLRRTGARQAISVVTTCVALFAWHGAAGATVANGQADQVLPVADGAPLVNVSGDFNHDGYPDLVVGNPLFTHDQKQEGLVDVYYGSPRGVSSTPAFHYETDVTYGFIGSSPIVADVNGDGFDDLVVGAYNYSLPGGEPFTGAVFVFFGSPSGLPSQPSQIIRGLTGAMNSFFGNSIRSLGDFNHDGFADIMVTAQAYGDTGAIEVFTGGPTGLAAMPVTTIFGTEFLGNFGGIVTTGDVNGDGFVDIIVGRPNGGGGLGRVEIYRGSVQGPATTPSEVITGGAAYDGFGTALAFLGDMDGDGFAELAIGAPDQLLDLHSSGLIYLYRGAAGGYAGTPPAQVLSPLNHGLAFVGFGGHMTGGKDLNGDGRPDLLVGTDYRALPKIPSDPFPGQIWIYLGAGTPGSPAFVRRPKQIDGTPGSWDALGYSALDAADLNGRGRMDIVSSGPVDGSGAPNGSVRVFFGELLPR